MALQYGTSWAIYLLTMKHQGAGTKGLQAHFRTTVDGYITAGMSINAAIVRATTEQIDPSVKSGDIGTIQSLDPSDLRPATRSRD